MTKDGRRMTKPSLLQALWDFIRAESWPASQEVVEAHPELLEDRAALPKRRSAFNWPH